ncbi:MAG: DUF58 domain-containing protein [Gammaproteobacteria bacterium]
MARPSDTATHAPDGHPVQVQREDLLRLRAQARSLANRGRITQRRAVTSPREGEFRSLFKGRGMDFEEVRGYQPGDDVRHMDWRVTARTGDPHIKIYREERERPIHVLVDLGPSMRFGSRVRFKSVQAARAATLIAWTARAQGDRIGGVVARGERHHELRPMDRDRGVMALIHALTDLDDGAQSGSEPTDLSASIARMERTLRPLALAVIISDFIGLNERSEQQLRRLSRHMDLLPVHVFDPLERDTPEPGAYPVVGPTGPGWLNLDRDADRRRYSAQYQDRHARLDALFRSIGAPVVHLATDDDISHVLGPVLCQGRSLCA